MYFVLNGQPSKIYRALLNPVKKRDLNALLEEISRGLQTAIFKIYTYEGLFGNDFPKKIFREKY